MLEHGHEEDVIDSMWEGAAARVQLPEKLRQDFHQPRGPMPPAPLNQRRFHRYYLRGKALLQRGDSVLGGYTKDVSRAGVGFFSPVQLLPKERISLRMLTAELSLEVARCHRLDQSCFECGARFAPVSSQ